MAAPSAKWNRDFQKALELDGWGQVEEAKSGYETCRHSHSTPFLPLSCSVSRWGACKSDWRGRLDWSKASGGMRPNLGGKSPRKSSQFGKVDVDRAVLWETR